jgi:hypothetical protein
LTSFPDFRTVLFDMNAGGGNAPVDLYGPDPNIPAGGEDNAVASVLFDNGLTGGPSAFSDQTLNGPQSLYYNATYRPYGVMEPVDIFETGGNVIPEPSSVMLALVALLGLAWRSGRPQRSMRLA